MKYSQERKPSAFGEISRAAELRPKQAVLARLAPPTSGRLKTWPQRKACHSHLLPLVPAGTP